MVSRNAPVTTWDRWVFTGMLCIAWPARPSRRFIWSSCIRAWCSVTVDRLAQQMLKLGKLFIEQGGSVGFEIQPKQRLGIAGADVKPPVAQRHGDAVEI